MPGIVVNVRNALPDRVELEALRPVAVRSILQDMPPRLALRDAEHSGSSDTVFAGKMSLRPSPAIETTPDFVHHRFGQLCFGVALSASSSFRLRIAGSTPLTGHVGHVVSHRSRPQMPPSRTQDAVDLVEALVIIPSTRRIVTCVEHLKAIGYATRRQPIRNVMGIEQILLDPKHTITIHQAGTVPLPASITPNDARDEAFRYSLKRDSSAVVVMAALRAVTPNRRRRSLKLRCAELAYQRRLYVHRSSLLRCRAPGLFYQVRGLSHGDYIR